MSIGEDRVRVQFNPSASNEVDQIKQKYADLINDLDNLRNRLGGNSEAQRLVSIAQTETEGAAMWAIKAITA